ncbi:low molecular weight phosphatase family protein [Streptomyces fagopyri]|uniref:hypothetical protein n=1 Tax=Streptomyces fagopyri TaxID=2662397 RepID=UPI0037F1FB19
MLDRLARHRSRPTPRPSRSSAAPGAPVGHGDRVLETVRASDVVITMGCGDTCPVFPGKRYLDWRLDDPAGQGVDAVRPIRDEIAQRIRGLPADLDG